MDSENVDDEDAEGVEIEEDFFSNPYIFDPVLLPNTPLARDVQGAEGKILLLVNTVPV
jgi:hypothetical protein